jgi:hypothetical protein
MKITINETKRKINYEKGMGKIDKRTELKTKLGKMKEKTE